MACSFHYLCESSHLVNQFIWLRIEATDGVCCQRGSCYTRWLSMHPYFSLFKWGFVGRLFTLYMYEESLGFLSIGGVVILWLGEGELHTSVTAAEVRWEVRGTGTSKRVRKSENYSYVGKVGVILILSLLSWRLCTTTKYVYYVVNT